MYTFMKQIRLHEVLIIFYEHFSVCIVSSKTQFLSNQIVLAVKTARQKVSNLIIQKLTDLPISFPSSLLITALYNGIQLGRVYSTTDCCCRARFDTIYCPDELARKGVVVSSNLLIELCAVI